MNAPLIDLALARELYQSDGSEDLTSVQREIWQEFKKSIRKDLDQLPSTIAAGEDSWKRAAHSIQGYSYTSGATEIGRLFREAQEPDKGPYWLMERRNELEEVLLATIREMEEEYPHLA